MTHQGQHMVLDGMWKKKQKKTTFRSAQNTKERLLAMSVKVKVPFIGTNMDKQVLVILSLRFALRWPPNK